MGKIEWDINNWVAPLGCECVGNVKGNRVKAAQSERMRNGASRQRKWPGCEVGRSRREAGLTWVRKLYCFCVN